jgi:hypothetical protein
MGRHESRQLRLHGIRLSLMVFVMLLIPFTTLADVVRLKAGGEVRGTVESQKTDADIVLVHTVHGSRIRMHSSDVELVVKREPVVEDYETRAKITPLTVTEQWKLAQWCLENRLKEQADIHFQHVVDLDPKHKAAHKSLDHILRDGEWHPRVQYMTERGFVKHKGRWITVEERDLAVKSELDRTAERKWHRRIHVLHGWLNGRNADRQADAVEELQNLNDPNAIPALVKHFQNDNDGQRRTFFVALLQDIGGPGTTAPLVKQGLLDVDRTIRQQALAAISADQRTNAAGLLVSELRSKSNEVIVRAAAALATLGDDTAVPQLIEALITTHKYRVKVADNSSTTSFGSDGSFSMGGGSVTRLPPDVEMSIRTGQLPYGAIVIPPNLPQRTRIVNVRVDHRNLEVLKTLVKLTGRDFGFDERAWRLWRQAANNG